MERDILFQDPTTTPFWRGCEEKKLLIQYSPQADAYQFYPRPKCVKTGGPVEWREAKGEGELYSRVIVRTPMMPGTERDVPYVVGLVDLDEGVRLLARVRSLDCKIGDRVTLVWTEREGLPPLPAFEVVGG